LTGERGSNTRLKKVTYGEALLFILVTKYEDEEIKEYKMGVAHGTNMGERNASTMFV
jgi:hypothetical protein